MNHKGIKLFGYIPSDVGFRYSSHLAVESSSTAFHNEDISQVEVEVRFAVVLELCQEQFCKINMCEKENLDVSSKALNNLVGVSNDLAENKKQ